MASFAQRAGSTPPEDREFIVGDESKREFTPEDRSDLESRGLAMPGGAYPIETVGDLRNAIHAYGRAKDPEKVRAWIIKRAHDLDSEDLLPEGWVDAEDDSDSDDMKASPMAAEHKVVPVTGLKVLDEAQGIVEAIVSVTGIEDRVKDTIEPGAYTKTLAERTPRGCWGHDWNTPISKTLEIKELLPGDPGLPKTLRNGEPWPAGAGALQVKTQFNLDTQRGREAYSDVRFFDTDQEWSIGYNVPPGGAKTDPKTGRRSIKQLILHEYSPVLHGAMPEAVTQSVKSAQEAYRTIEEKRALPEDEPKPQPKPKPGPPPKRSGSSGTVDASGHVHVASGPKGGQFAPSAGGDSNASTKPADKPTGPKKTPVDPLTGKPFSAHQLHVLHMAHIGKPMPGYAIVGKGTTLRDIAKEHLGDENRWADVAKANGIKDPRKVPTGSLLRLPAKTKAPAKKDDAPVGEADLLAYPDLAADEFVGADSEPGYDLDDIDAALYEALDDEPRIEIEVPGEALSDDDVALLFGESDTLTEDDLYLLHTDPEVLADADAGEEKSALAFTEWAGEYGAEVKKGNAETLRRYWAEGEGAAKIRWGQSGDFDRCVREVDKYMPGRAKGYCNLLHHRALGYYPATHAAMDRAGKADDEGKQFPHGRCKTCGKHLDTSGDCAEHGAQKDVVGGSYPLAVQPGLAGADGEPEMVEVAKPGEPCPECGQDTDERGRCMNPDCEHFGMAVKHLLTPEEAAAGLDALMKDARADITLDVMQAVRFFDDAEEKGYIRRQAHGGWLWAGWHGSPDTRGRSTHADFARLGGGHVPEGWDVNDRNRHMSMRSAAQALNAEARAGTGSSPRNLAPKRGFTRGGLELTQALDHPDGGRLQRDGRTYRVDNVRKGVFERWKVTDEESGHSVEVNGPGSTESVQRRASRRMEAFSGAVHDLRQRQATPASAVDVGAAPSAQRHKVQVGQQMRQARRAQRHEIPATHREARHASQNIALADTFRPMNRMKDQAISDEIQAMRRRLASERPERGSLRSNLIRSRIADLAREQRRRSGKDDGPLVLDEFGPEEFAAQERARVLALQSLWDDAKAMPPMGEYDRWSDEQLGYAVETITDTLDGDDVPEPFARALQAELTAITAAQDRVSGKVDMSRDVLEAIRLFADVD